jgi:hypothetical protein
MAAPNLKSPTNIVGKSLPYSCSASLDSVLSNSAASGKVLKINSVRACNIDATSPGTIDITLFRDSTHSYISYRIVVPTSASLVVISKEEYLYLEEGDALYAKAGSINQIVLTISYEDIS